MQFNAEPSKAGVVSDDGGTDAGVRARERRSRIGLTTGIGAAARVMTIAASFVGVPIALAALGETRYGVWLTISSLTALLTFSNLGVGNSLVNAIARANADDDSQAAARAISSGLLVLGAIAAGLILVSVVAYLIVPWSSVFNVRDVSLSNEARLASLTALVLYAVSIPGATVDAVRLGYQRAYITHAFAIVSSILSVGALVIVAAVHPIIPLFVIALVGPTVALQFVNWAMLVRSLPGLRPRRAFVDRAVASDLLRVGALFLVLQLSTAVAFESNNLILAQVLGPTAVTEYVVASRMFMVPMAVVGLVASALWPAYREAIVRGDTAWVSSTLRRSVVLVAGFSAVSSVALLAFHRPLLDLWVGPGFPARFELLVALAIWTVLWSVGTAVGSFLYGAELLRFQIGIALAMAGTNVVLSVFLTARLGISGVVWGSVIAYTLVTLLPLAVLVPRLLVRIGASPIVGVER